MLFSNPTVAKYINASFEPAWEKVSDLPYLDLGKTIQRVAAGNIATQICDQEGRVLDILPSLYGPVGYTMALEQARLLEGYLRGTGDEYRRAFLQWYYVRRAVSQTTWHPRFEETSPGSRASKVYLRNGAGAPVRPQTPAKPPADEVSIQSRPDVAGDVQKELRLMKRTPQDHGLEHVSAHFRKPVSDLLAEKAGVAMPIEITRTLFMDILHVRNFDDLLLNKHQVAQRDAEQRDPGHVDDEPEQRRQVVLLGGFHAVGAER